MNGPALRDIHLPSAPWWPLAPGWWALLVVLLLVAAGVVWWLRHKRKQGPLRAALREVDRLTAAHAADGDDARLAEGASRLLRRVALRIDPAAAAQDGAAWGMFVHAHARDAATRQTLDELATQRFRAQPALDAPALLAALRTWCRDAMRMHAPQARGDATRNAKAHPPQSPFRRKGEDKLPPGTRAREDAARAESTLREPTP